MRRRLAAMLPFCLLCLGLPGQRPTSATDALARFARVAGQAEGQRRQAVRALGDFPDPEVTNALLREFAAATQPGYRQDLARALGKQPRPEAVPALAAAMRAGENQRLLEVIASALANQGDAGAAAVLDGAVDQRPLRQAAIVGLGDSRAPAARARLVREATAAPGRDRLPPLRALATVTGDPAVDELRSRLVLDADLLVAGLALEQCARHDHPDLRELALGLHRRCPATAPLEAHAALVHAFLRAPGPADFEPLLQHGAQAGDVFGKHLLPLWEKALQDGPLPGWLEVATADRKSLAERALAVRALGLVRGSARTTAAKALTAQLAAKDPTLVAAAVAALVALGADVAVTPLQGLAARGSEPARALAMAALVTLQPADPALAAMLLAAARGKDVAPRTAALRLLPDLQPVPTDALSSVHGSLDHRHWTVRAAAIAACRELRQAASIPLLFARLPHEQARLREDLLDALHDLTGLRYHELAPWQAWWQQEGPGFQVLPRTVDRDDDRDDDGDGDAERPRRDRRKPKADDAGTVSYWDIPVTSTRVVFVVDVSGSMNQPFGTGGSTRIDEARRQLSRVLTAVADKSLCNVIAFGSDARGFAERLQPIDGKRRAGWQQQVAQLAVGGATNVHAALQLAFADPEVDTIFLLTDGQPSAGAITAPAALADEVARWNLTRQVRIHTVALGGRSAFLQRLADDSGGIATVAR